MITQGMPLVLKEADPNLLKISESAEGLQQNTGPARASAQVAPRRSPSRKTRQLFMSRKTTPGAVSGSINCRLASVASGCPCWQWCRATS